MKLFGQRNIEHSLNMAHHKAIEIVSIRRSYLERRGKSAFRKIQQNKTTFRLTESQIKGAVSEAKETLVVAGAGTGKTSLLIGRATYLVETNKASADEILILAFNNKAALEITTRAGLLDIPITASTFHKFGKTMLEENGDRRVVAFSESQQVDKFFENEIRKMESDSVIGSKLVSYFAGQLVPVKNYEDYKSLNEYTAYVKSMPKTLQGEFVKSHGEWLIANFLWSMSVEYEYEALYTAKGDPKASHKPDFHLSGTSIYIEYFGIDANGNTAPGIDAQWYKATSELKRQTHKREGTTLIELTYQDLRNGQLTKKLFSELKRHLSPEQMKRKSNQQILFQANEVGYQKRFLKVCTSFLGHVRSSRPSDFVLRQRANSERDHFFLDIFTLIYLVYENKLAELNQPDFSELIHGGADAILEREKTLGYKYVMVDEFQDISHDRFRMISAIATKNPEARFTFVGDDWQGINGFAGSDISIMRKLSKAGSTREYVALEDTFRMPQKLATMAGDFVSKNGSQLEKTLRSNLPMVSRPVSLHWDTTPENNEDNLKLVIERIGEAANDPTMELQVLARYSNNLPSEKYLTSIWEGPVSASTIHSAKGLEADYVIVVDLVQDFRGFPSTIEDDPVLHMVLPDAETFPFAEERRLFYVALTRARKEVHLICSAEKPSLFATEMLTDKVGIHYGDQSVKSCPVCKTGIMAKGQKNGNYRCSNSPLCEFKLPKCYQCSKYGQLISVSPVSYRCPNHDDQIWSKCPKCEFGALVPRTGKYGDFEGCHMFGTVAHRAK